MEGADTEQIEALRDWWRRNGNYVVTGLVIAVLVIAGWLVWNYWQGKQAGAAAEAYASVVLAEQKGNMQAVIKRAHTLQSNYPGTAYSALAGLTLAKAQFSQHHFIKADKALEHVIHHAPDQGFANIARLRLARIQLQQGKARAALSTLDESKIAQAFAVSANTLRGEAFVALGRIDDARRVWRAAQAMNTPGSSRYQLLAMRLSGLPASSDKAVATQSAATQQSAKASTLKTAADSGHVSASSAGTAGPTS